MRVWLAIRVFVKTLLDGEMAARFVKVLEGDEPARPAAPPPAREPRPAPVRNDAISLLATLQREARLVDVVREPLGEYSDAQIGAAARDVLRDCGTVLERLFAIRPISQAEEGTEVEAPAPFDAGRYRVTGNVQGEPPFRGRLTHHGWEATRCELPQWTGSPDSARVIAPLELEMQ